MVGLVDDGDLDPAQVEMTLRARGREPARAGDDDIDAGPQVRRFAGPRRTPPKTVIVRSDTAFASGAMARVDLGRELSRRSEDERAGPERPPDDRFWRPVGLARGSTKA